MTFGGERVARLLNRGESGVEFGDPGVERGFRLLLDGEFGERFVEFLREFRRFLSELGETTANLRVAFGGRGLAEANRVERLRRFALNDRFRFELGVGGCERGF